MQTVSVRAPARLHLGFIDLQRGRGRQFGSLGLCLSDIATHLTAKKSPEIVVSDPSGGDSHATVAHLLDHFGIEGGVDITLHEAIPAHTGLGSGTQFSLAMGMAISKLYGRQTTVAEIAKLTARGMRSGIGIGAFSHGGFLVDGGRGKDTVVPPITSRCDFPEAWRVLLVFDHTLVGVAGCDEQAVFERLPPLDEVLSGRVCRLVLTRVLPALAECDCGDFGAAITDIQTLMGEHFSAAQQGRYSSERVAEVMDWLWVEGAAGVGQSSWGPTGFAIYATDDDAQHAMQAAKTHWADEACLDFRVCRGRNMGAEIQKDEKK